MAQLERAPQKAVDEPSLTDISNERSEQNGTQKSKESQFRILYDRLGYVPPRCRYDPEKPFEFSMSLNVLFGTPIWLFFMVPTNQVDSLRRMLHSRKPLLHTPYPQPTCR